MSEKYTQFCKDCYDVLNDEMLNIDSNVCESCFDKEYSRYVNAEMNRAQLECPNNEPLHFHHDGCPACEGEFANNKSGLVAAIDEVHYNLIRANVGQFMRGTGKAFDNKDIILLDVAPQDHAGAAVGFKKATIETLDIDPNANATYTADLCKDNSDVIDSERFDIVVCTEVIEHTLNPFNVVKELHRVLKVGGKALISVPFNFRIHGPLPDCWRISEHGLKALFNKDSGFRITLLDALETDDRFLMPIHYTLIAEKI